ncbi:a-factor receptor [Elasticomyces elasticus]|uniref:A-factor receptor n=1 Tax=Exophiala sideris TaxID=1016849 RepID=A0ABR0J3P3_9EURO|nr:a-factor receptor [Elasticomyces elasticus]KAK5027009.1 a-factor receptor [Exophiala sideris]KAK5034013.1 a-factor receptor [Exophiala sideris]KAK5055712.1 a-factor receptor [Exophiala sideris]KAK5180955.1 a-factor receptor [Eurotiomycetes sp. CCFEE 6388]
MYRSFYSVVVAILALLSCLSSLPPLIVHIKAKNLATTVLILSFAFPNLQNFVNALIWPSDNTALWWNGKILCDIEVKLYLGMDVAVDGALACIFRHIANILDTNRMSVTPSRRERNLGFTFALCSCVIAPAFVMGTHYLIQQTRYYVRPLSGCTPSVYWAWPSILLMSIWPLLLCVIATVYCGIETVRLWRHRKEMSAVLGNPLSRSGDIRLFALACVVLVVYVPFTLVAFAGTLFRPMHEYSWDYVHPPGWADNIVYEVQGMQPSIDRWAQIVTGYIIFGFMGLGHDAKQMYGSWLMWVKCCFGKHSDGRRSGGSEPTRRILSSSTQGRGSTLEGGTLVVVIGNGDAAGTYPALAEVSSLDPTN